MSTLWWILRWWHSRPGRCWVVLGGALFHMLPSAVEALGSALTVYLWFTAGFITFHLLEQYLHWHHCHRGADCESPPTGTLILLADGLHNLVGGLAVGRAS
jgi:zinc and cadmium transporter